MKFRELKVGDRFLGTRNSSRGPLIVFNQYGVKLAEDVYEVRSLSWANRCIRDYPSGETISAPTRTSLDMEVRKMDLWQKPGSAVICEDESNFVWDTVSGSYRNRSRVFDPVAMEVHEVIPIWELKPGRVSMLAEVMPQLKVYVFDTRSGFVKVFAEHFGLQQEEFEPLLKRTLNVGLERFYEDYRGRPEEAIATIKLKSRRTKFHLLTILDGKNVKGVAIAENRRTSSGDYGVLYKAWDEFLGLPDDKCWTHCFSLWEPHVTPQGIPYVYDLVCSGGLYRFFNFGLDQSVVEEASNWLRSQHDVVTLDITNVELVEWTPPEPFEAIALPDWIKHNTKEGQPT